MESPSHIAIVTAYLYSWLKSALPIDSVSLLIELSQQYVVSLNLFSSNLTALLRHLS